MLVIKHLIHVLSIVSSSIGIQMFLLFNSSRYLPYCSGQCSTGVGLSHAPGSWASSWCGHQAQTSSPCRGWWSSSCSPPAGALDKASPGGVLSCVFVLKCRTCSGLKLFQKRKKKIKGAELQPSCTWGLSYLMFLLLGDTKLLMLWNYLWELPL